MSNLLDRPSTYCCGRLDRYLLGPFFTIADIGWMLAPRSHAMAACETVVYVASLQSCLSCTTVAEHQTVCAVLCSGS